MVDVRKKGDITHNVYTVSVTYKHHCHHHLDEDSITQQSNAVVDSVDIHPCDAAGNLVLKGTHKEGPP
jgi:hypothetical protein